MPNGDQVIAIRRNDRTNDRKTVAFAVIAAIAVGLSGVAVAGPPSGGALPPQLTQVVAVAGVAGVPVDAVGVALNVTVTNPVAGGFVTVHPCREVRPVASNVNYVRDQTVPNLVISGLDVDGDVCISTLAVTDLVVDVAGYIPAGSPVQPLPEPVRFLDTREGIGAPLTRVAAGQVLQVRVAGTSGVPADAGTVVFNTTVVSPSTAGFVSVYPCGLPVPDTSTVNFVTGGIVPNLTVTAVGAGGAVCLYSTAATDLVADVAAYVPAGAAGVTMLASPQRILDTRIGLGGPDEPVASAARPVSVAGVAGVPAGASAAVLNLTATGGAGAGYAAAFPCGIGVPLVSNLNFARNQNVANAAIVKLAVDGRMCLSANQPVDLIVDVTGYVVGTSALVPVTPQRIFDTREGVEPRCGIGLDLHRDLSSVPWLDTYSVYDLATGARRNDLRGLPVVWSSKAFVMADCRILVVGLADTVGMQLWEFSSDGTLISSRYVPGFTGGAGVVGSPTALFAIGHFDRVIRADTGEQLFTVPSLGIADGGGARSIRLLRASSDGTVLVFAALGPDTTSGLQFDLYYVATDGRLLTTVSLPVGAWPIDVSPDLAYVLSFLRADPRSVGDYRVSTRRNAIVSAITEGRDPNPQQALSFVTSGLINACDDSTRSGRALRWEIFNELRSFSAGTLPCLEAIG